MRPILGTGFEYEFVLAKKYVNPNQTKSSDSDVQVKSDIFMNREFIEVSEYENDIDIVGGRSVRSSVL